MKTIPEQFEEMLPESIIKNLKKTVKDLVSKLLSQDPEIGPDKIADFLEAIISDEVDNFKDEVETMRDEIIHDIQDMGLDLESLKKIKQATIKQTLY